MAATGRFDDTTSRGEIYVHTCGNPTYLDPLDERSDIAQSAGCRKADLAYQWVRYHSLLRREWGDAVLFATSSLGQLRMTMKGFITGSLGKALVHRVKWIVGEFGRPCTRGYV
ncbi:hypothetical protein BDV38DRAFT_243206 [Aspergillus pseudotamarii]|uniref:NADP-dependent oxidoreductase domain-containing protein n=1 Tax=Aspergillus pseudotamarii TaxID=132259 RepID=A0A5N6SZN6_ASPPS|nr:uncharacterized protein BDV38DRAFT_243206 [Aspergillus pseudotamarii]KAE8138903.1 hypothetical protein BDV38DRAFT_243206 [Aspergillus pseudotamarii]